MKPLLFTHTPKKPNPNPLLKIVLRSSLLALALAFSFSAQMALAQMVETDLGSQNAALLVIPLLGPGVTASNVTFQGGGNSAGSFTGGNSILGFDSGIILSTGSAAAVVGNAAVTSSTCNSLPGDSDLALLAGNPVIDATVLQFDFIPTFNTITFRYVFASEEYNDYVGSSFNDVFGFFVNGVNVALVPGTSTVVSTNNINNCVNPGYFIDNIGSPQGGTCRVTRASAGLGTTMNGLTTILTVTAGVNPGVVNHIKLAIADVGDCRNDSNVFIQANSFSSAFTPTDTPILTPTPCGWPGLTCTFTQTPTMTPTETIAPTDTPCGWPGLTCTRTPTETFTWTPTNQNTPTPTFTITNTATTNLRPSNTPTITNTPSPTNSFTPTYTPSPTSTPTPTLTPCGWPGLTCTPTHTPTPTPSTGFTDIFTLDKNVFNVSIDQKVNIYVGYSQYPGPFSLKVYNTAGEYIQTLGGNPHQNSPIDKPYTWDGLNWRNEPCASGVYIFYLIEPYSRKVKKLVLIR